jgi:cyclopropane fatty-acyl-phospholipid synthase-like methyltransferase
MIKETRYHPDWQINRINFILSKYPEEFFKGKRILELGAYNGYIGAYFAALGATVHCVEGRQENVDKIKKDYPQVTAEVGNCDTAEWVWGDWDIIINFGLYYHLEHHHKEHMINCLNHCGLMFFETVIYDSNESEIYFREEVGDDQSLTTLGGTPSTSYVENIFDEVGVEYTKYSDASLNNFEHKYDWVGFGLKKFDAFKRRFWIINLNDKNE